VKIVIEKVTALPTVGGTEKCQTADGVVHTGPGCIYAAARHLIGRGVSPRAHLRFIRNGQVCLTGRVETFAARNWGGAERDPHDRKWVPDPRYPLPPLLQAWWESNQ
jgi:hypothetical protein